MSLRFKLSVAIGIAIITNTIAFFELKHQIVVLGELVETQELKYMKLEQMLTGIDSNMDAIDEHLTEQFIDSTIIKYCKTTLFLDYLEQRRINYYNQHTDNPDILLPDDNNHGSLSAINRVYQIYYDQRTQMLSILGNLNINVPSKTQCDIISEHLL